LLLSRSDGARLRSAQYFSRDPRGALGQRLPGSSAPLEMASYVAHILKGAKLADLPVQQSTTLEMVVNLKAAKALGITIPTGILLRADGTIE
jgi:putative ABC transport system substrate-binding protein